MTNHPLVTILVLKPTILDKVQATNRVQLPRSLLKIESMVFSLGNIEPNRGLGQLFLSQGNKVAGSAKVDNTVVVSVQYPSANKSVSITYISGIGC